MNVGSILGAGGDASLTGEIMNSSMGREEFLKLLLVQLQMQDPLDPMKHDEMIAQLAQFSSLEQLENMNIGLERNLEMDLLLGQLLNNTLATTLIGKAVRVRGDAFVLSEDKPASLGYGLEADAASVSVSIYNADGKRVATIEDLGRTKGEHTFSWHGRDDQGNRLLAGSYTFSVEATDGEDGSITAEEMLVGVVDGIRYRDGIGRLMMGENEILMSQVLEIFEHLEEGGSED